MLGSAFVYFGATNGYQQLAAGQARTARYLLQCPDVCGAAHRRPRTCQRNGVHGPRNGFAHAASADPSFHGSVKCHWSTHTGVSASLTGLRVRRGGCPNGPRSTSARPAVGAAEGKTAQPEAPCAHAMARQGPCHIGHERPVDPGETQEENTNCQARPSPRPTSQ